MKFATEDLSIQPGGLPTPKCGYDTAQKPCATFLPTPVSEKSSRGVLSVLDPNKISWVSPALTVSTTSSPAGFNDMWDVPETPTKRTTSASPRSILAPFTPATPPDSSKKLLFTPIPKPFFGVAVTPAIPQPFFQEKQTAAQDDPFQPKLFRGVTLVLEEISKASVAAATVKYNSNPTFVFTQNTSISTRTRSKTASTTPTASAIHTAIREETTIVTSPQGRIHPPLDSKFSKLLEQLVPHDLHARLASAPGYCPASLVTSLSTRCSSMAKPRGSVIDAISAVKNISKCNRQEDYCGMLRNIEAILQSVMCIRHQHAALRQLKAGSRLSQLRSKLEGTTRMTALDHSTLKQWVSTISDLDASNDQAARTNIIATKSKPLTQPKRELKPMSKLPTVETIARFSPSSGFRTYEPKKTRGLSVFSALYEKAASPLGTKDLTPGYVYLFWEGLLWHGEDRAHQEFSQATQDVESQVVMPHVHRVEQLIHTELKGCRLRRQCEGCGKLHKEWFEASQAHVVKVMKKWREWILQEPYVQDEESGEWVLKPEMFASLERMCEPLPQDAATYTPRRKSAGMQRGSQKRKSPRRTIIFEAAKLVRARHAPATAASQGEASDRTDTGKVTKTIVRNRGRVAGNYEKTRSSYGSFQPNSIYWASEADWLKPFLGTSPPLKGTMMLSLFLKPAAKIVYILKHELTDDDAIALLAGCGISDKSSDEFARARKRLRDYQSEFQGEVMNDFIYPRVAMVICEWKEQAANADKAVEDLTPAQLEALWQGDFDKDPERMAAAMWGDVGKSILWDKLYNLGFGTAEVKIKLQAARDMFRDKYVFACEQTLKMRYCNPSTLEDDDEALSWMTPAQRCYAKWRGFRHDERFTDTIVGYASLPVHGGPPNDRRKQSSAIAVPKMNEHDAEFMAALLNSDYEGEGEEDDEEVDIFAD
ncbi:uncharacterized protein J4E88_010823 [Alternaria novae-zelandiae]|uniref:uncharacterized protein n=1 Tax=Alternaria novae-zelandiae TaxID=430562 RepID=UPI0020C44127|nr:uncharacterized protein J4E88_010823 [Alternaria novae-zelandiae]KAI4663188.1 hypothetical protein J4E88_010823 [Alternaria novae-zelandiae]